MFEPILRLDPWALGFVVLAFFVAAVIRGYSGFGFSLLAVSSLSLVLPPAETVPIVLLLEVLASLNMLPPVWRQVDWRSLGVLLAGAVAATPFGIQVLATVPEAPLRLALSLVVTVTAVLLWRGFALTKMPNAAATVATGVASGLLNGSLGIGGPPVILFYLSSPAGAAMSRASIVAYFLGTDSVGLALAGAEGLVGWHTIVWTIALLPLLLVGIAVGSRGFITTDPARFRRYVLVILILLSVAGAARAVLG